MRSHRFPQVGWAHPRLRQYLNVKHHHSKVPRRALTLEGVWALRHAVAAHVVVEVVFVCIELVRGEDTYRSIDEARAGGAVVLQVSRRVLERIVDRDGPDGVAAIAQLPEPTLGQISVAPSTRLIVVDGIELAGNLGAIVRCADGAGASAVILTNSRTRVTHPLAVKASMGTVFSMPIVDASTQEVIAWIRHRGVRLVAADPSAASSYRGAYYRGPVALLLGSERYGLTSAWREMADALVSIPMLGVADSLNIGHAAALLLYEALHQHR